MLPILRIGSWQLSMYGLMYGLGVFVLGGYGFTRLLRLGLPAERLGRSLLRTIAGGVLGSYAPMLWLTLQAFLQSGQFALTGAPNILWALFAGLGVAAVECRRNGTPLRRALDLGLLPLPLAFAIVRIGCLAAGCCYGRATSSSLGMVLPDPHGHWQARYPTQIISGLADLAIFGLLALLERRSERANARPSDGWLALSAVGLLCTKRFLVEFLRADYAPLLGPLSWPQLYAAAGLLAVAALGWRLGHKTSPQDAMAERV